MTTIAYDGNTIAVDKQMTEGSIKSKIDKLHKYEDDIWVAFCGDLEHCYQAIAYLNNDCKDDFDDEDLDYTLVFFNSRTKKCRVYSKKNTFIEVYPPYAVGSGAMSAMTAMYMGLNAPDAVNMAAKVDVFTGMGIDYIDANKKVEI